MDPETIILLVVTIVFHIAYLAIGWECLGVAAAFTVMMMVLTLISPRPTIRV